jgi:truncated hemoglobin YjbI
MGCSSSNTVGKTLYDRLGKEDGIQKVCRDMYDKVFADPLINGFFTHFYKEKLANRLGVFLIGVLGGPNT